MLFCCGKLKGQKSKQNWNYLLARDVLETGMAECFFLRLTVTVYIWEVMAKLHVMLFQPSGGWPFVQPSTGTTSHHTKQKTNSNKGPGKRRVAAVSASVAQSPLRVFFNPDTCKPFYHDLQWGKCRLGAGRPPEELFAQQMMRNTVLFRPDICSSLCTNIWSLIWHWKL